MVNTVLSIDIGTKNLGYTIAKFNSRDSVKNLLFDMDIYTIDDKNNCDVVSYRIKKIRELFDRLQLPKETLVIIERQVQTNVIAMELMYAIAAISMERFSIPIIIFDPKRKFNYIKEEYSTTSKSHKKKSTEFACKFLQDNFIEKYNTFKMHTKKDDLSDSLIQLLVTISENKMVSENYEKLRLLLIN